MQEFATRRQRLLEQVGADAIVILSSSHEVVRNGDSPYPFRQQSDFYYLTGLNEPEAFMVLMHKDGKPYYILYNRPNDPLMETWNGKRAGQKGAVKEFGADKSYETDDFIDHLPELLESVDNVYYPLGYDTNLDDYIMTGLNELRMQVRKGVSVPRQFFDLNPVLHEMRLFKSDDEIQCLRIAAEITVEAHKRAMQTCKPGLFEYQLQAEIEYTFLKNGCSGPAYTSIVGSGANSCILHYINNNQPLIDGDVVLIDAGAEYQNYSADVTRTFPVNGKFSEAQTQIYQLVLKAQLAVIDSIKPGLVWDEMQAIVVDIFVEGLLALEILQGDKANLIKNKAYFDFYMHRSGHWLGLDTHDAGSYRIDNKTRVLEPGMVCTVEPGLYFAPDNDAIDKKWWNIGVRIEDDVLVTATGCDVLSKDLPKTIEDIEALMAGA